MDRAKSVARARHRREEIHSAPPAPAQEPVEHEYVPDVPTVPTVPTVSSISDMPVETIVEEPCAVIPSDVHVVPWVPRKPVDHALVAQLLSDSDASGHYTNYGPVVQRLEETLRTILHIEDSKAVVCTSSGTSALYAIWAALCLKDGKSLKFATQSFGFPSSAQVHRGVKIIDIDESGGLDLSAVPESVDGLIVTNVFGNVVEISKYTSFCSERSKYLVFDNAATPLTFYHGKNSCNFGDASVISLHHTKLFGFGEGGAAIVDKSLEPYVRRIINFGIDNQSETPRWSPLGFNGKMSDVSAAYILQFLTNNFPMIASHQVQLYEHLKESLVSKGINARTYPNFSDGTPVVACFTLMFATNTSSLVEYLRSNGIYCRRYYDPLDERCLVSKRVQETVLCLPCHMGIERADIDRITDLIQTWCSAV
jgi:dTDP-4-amino-4,6-dideoxygalactose transaminase